MFMATPHSAVVKERVNLVYELRLPLLGWVLLPQQLNREAVLWLDLTGLSLHNRKVKTDFPGSTDSLKLNSVL